MAQQQLDQLVAPVALYADPVVVDILTASTYPLEVVEAQRWVADPANNALNGDALTAALGTLDWDPSVKALVPFPQILQMMDSHLDWTQRLGEAFLAQQSDVMDAIQRLRHQAQTAGTLKSSPQQTVAVDGDDVTISPATPDEIFVPAYDPWCVYGPWAYPVYPPYYFTPWPGYCSIQDYAVDFDVGVFVPFGFWDWGYFDWRHHNIGIHRDRYDQFHSGHVPAGSVWRHDPSHRVGVPYRDPRNVEQFRPGQDYHQSFRGYEGRSGEPVESDRPSPPAFEHFGSGHDIQLESQRGQISRQGMSGGISGSGFGGVRGGSGGRGGGGRH